VYENKRLACGDVARIFFNAILNFNGSLKITYGVGSYKKSNQALYPFRIIKMTLYYNIVNCDLPESRKT